MKKRLLPLAIVHLMIASGLVLSFATIEARADEPQPTTVTIFSSDTLHFNAEDPDRYRRTGQIVLDNGRGKMKTIALPGFERPVSITAEVTIHPIPKDETSVCDPWDRAGNVRLAFEDRPDIEIVKFITPYGGEATYSRDVSFLAPLLQGKKSFVASIDTWVTPAWIVDFSLTYEEIVDTTGDSIYIDYIPNPDWAEPVLYEQSFTAETEGQGGVQAEVDIPDGIQRVVLAYMSSGHCTDGSGADEFVPKDNVISVDGAPVYRFQPWRDDCRDFRDINPYTRKWSDGYWSSDFSRSGWCPGGIVEPVRIDLTDHLTPGHHTLTFKVENVRPKDEDGNHGYWRISSYLVGWEKKVNLVRW
jgi:hypothetical protein